jgi:hypothetical protein
MSGCVVRPACGLRGQGIITLFVEMNPQSAHRGKASSRLEIAFVRRKARARAQLDTYHRRVGARTIRRRDESVRRNQENLTLWTIISAIVFPMLLAVAFVGMDMRSDLSELKSSAQMDNKGAVPVGWPDLERWNDGLGRVRMIGYMTDGYQPSRDGATVDMFVLLPEAGQFLHPAHRIPNQMVDVHPIHPVVFRYRDLVWASGTLTRTIGSPGAERAAFALTAAEVNPAAERDIGRWFHP